MIEEANKKQSEINLDILADIIASQIKRDIKKKLKHKKDKAKPLKISKTNLNVNSKSK